MWRTDKTTWVCGVLFMLASQGFEGFISPSFPGNAAGAGHGCEAVLFPDGKSMEFCGVDPGCIRALPQGLFAARGRGWSCHCRLGDLRGAAVVWVLLWELWGCSRALQLLCLSRGSLTQLLVAPAASGALGMLCQPSAGAVAGQECNSCI